MEEVIKKKRGRKPKNFYNNTSLITEEIISTEKKKRGRKKKYEIENFEKIHNREKINNFNHNIAYSDDEEPVNNDNNIKKVSFGNLNILVSKKESAITNNSYRNEIINKVNKSGIDENEYSDEEEIKIPIEDILNLNEEKFEKFYKEKKKYSTNDSLKENSLKRMRIVTTLKNIINEEEWPSSTDVCCWWCCNKFNNSPCTLPTKYDPLRKRYTFIGIFCSWNCVKAYNLEKSDRKVAERAELITQLIKQLYSIEQSINVKPSPHRQCLKMFGGYMSIEEFRNQALYVDAYYMNLTKYNYIYPEITEITNVKLNAQKQDKKNLRLSRT
jgi:hypothetical protein